MHVSNYEPEASVHGALTEQGAQMLIAIPVSRRFTVYCSTYTYTHFVPHRPRAIHCAWTPHKTLCGEITSMWISTRHAQLISGGEIAAGQILSGPAS
jgi:hypothetical protein